MKDNIKYIISLITLLALVICLGNIAMADEVITDEKIEIIEAEDIGIKTIEKVQEDEIIEVPVDETDVEDEVLDVPVQNKPEETEEEQEYESPEAVPVTEEIEETEAPVGMVEGYEEGVYFEPNTFDCEAHEECYKCKECTIEESLFIDEEINPDGEHWVLCKICIVCGDTTNEPVDDNFINEYYE